MPSYVYHASLIKDGEDVCGDTVKYTAVDDSVLAVLSDGLGSGVKANILSRLTVEILHSMGAANLPLEVIFETVTRSLPVCRERGIAYAAFCVAKVGRQGHTQLWCYDTPDPVVISGGQVAHPDYQCHDLGGRTVRVADLELSQGDSIYLLSDGVLFAGLGRAYNFGWGWDHVAEFVAAQIGRPGGSVAATVRALSRRVLDLYGHRPGDDATVLGVEVRDIRRLILFTGPPVDPDQDAAVTHRFLTTPGQKVVCGGTTANIVARETGWQSTIDLATARPDVPPMGSMEGLEFVTEGVLTLAKTIELVRDAAGEAARLPAERTGATCLAQALLAADHVHFIVGLKVHPSLQNPLLPISVSLRRYLLEELERLLTAAGKSVVTEYH